MEISKFNGRYDFGGDTVVSGKNAAEFRQSANKREVLPAKPDSYSPGELLSHAKTLLGVNAETASDDDVATAYSYLKGIPATAPEYKEARRIIPTIEVRAKRIIMKLMEPYGRKK